MKRHDSDDSPVAAKLQRFDLSGKALYKKKIVVVVVVVVIIVFSKILLCLFLLPHQLKMQYGCSLQQAPFAFKQPEKLLEHYMKIYNQTSN